MRSHHAAPGEWRCAVKDMELMRGVDLAPALFISALKEKGVFCVPLSGGKRE